MILHTELELYNSKLMEMTGREETIVAKMVIDTDEIVAVRESYSDDNDPILEEHACRVYLRSGENFSILFPYEELLKIKGWNK